MARDFEAKYQRKFGHPLPRMTSRRDSTVEHGRARRNLFQRIFDGLFSFVRKLFGRDRVAPVEESKREPKVMRPAPQNRAVASKIDPAAIGIRRKVIG